MTLGERIEFLMKKHNLKGEEFAKIFNKSGSNSSSILNDKTKPSPDLAIEICKYFGCTLDWLWTGEESYIKEQSNKKVEEPQVVYDLQNKYVKILEENLELRQKLNKQQEEEIKQLQQASRV